MPLLSSGGWLSPCLQGTFCSMPGAGKEGASAVPGCGWGLQSDPSLCVCPEAWENLWGVAPCPQTLSGQLRKSILLKCHGWKDQREGGRVVQEDKWKRVCRKTSELAPHRDGEPAAPPGAGGRAPGRPQPRRRPRPRPAAQSLRGWLREQREVKILEAGPGSLGPRGPRGCWAVVVGREEKARGGWAWPIRGRRRTRRCSGCPWWWGAPRGSA